MNLFKTLIIEVEMLFVVVYVIAFIIFLVALLPLQIIFIIVNFFIPDPIPILDEALMGASIIKKILALENIIEFAEEHPGLFKAIIVGAIIVLLILAKSLWF